MLQKIKPSQTHFFTFIHSISLIGFFVAIYLICAPLLPRAITFAKTNLDATKGYKYQSALAHIEGEEKHISNTLLQAIPQVDTLVIPKIGVDSSILESENEQILSNGLWRKPNTSTPDKGGNTVITAHRFLKVNGPNTFYDLDKLDINDTFMIFWKGKEYDYRVYEKKNVDPSQTEIENNSLDSIVTLYTCTPLWYPTQRLIIRARLVQLDQ